MRKRLLLLLMMMSVILAGCTAITQGVRSIDDTIIRYEIPEHKYFFPVKLEEGYKLKDLRPQDYIVSGKVYSYEDVLVFLAFETASNRPRYVYTGQRDEKNNGVFEFNEKAIFKLHFNYLPEEESKKHVQFVSLPHIPMEQGKRRGAWDTGSLDKNAVKLHHNEMMKLIEDYYTNVLSKYIEENTDNIVMDKWGEEELQKAVNDYIGRSNFNDYIMEVSIKKLDSLTLGLGSAGGMIRMLNKRPEGAGISMGYHAFSTFKIRGVTNRPYLSVFSHELTHMMGIRSHTEKAVEWLPNTPYMNEVKRYMLKNFIICDGFNDNSIKTLLITPEELVMLDFINSPDFYYQNYGTRELVLVKYINMSRYKVGSMYLTEALMKYHDVDMFEERVKELKDDPYFMEYLLTAFYSVDESYYGYNAKGAYEKRGIKYDLDEALDDIDWNQRQAKKYPKEKEKYEKWIEDSKRDINTYYQPLLDEVDPIIKMYPRVKEIVSQYVPKDMMEIEAEDGFRFKYYPPEERSFRDKNGELKGRTGAPMYKYRMVYENEYKYRDEYAYDDRGMADMKKSAFYQRIEQHILNNNPEILEMYIKSVENPRRYNFIMTVESSRIGEKPFLKKFKTYKKRLRELQNKQYTN